MNTLVQSFLPTGQADYLKIFSFFAVSRQLKVILSDYRKYNFCFDFFEHIYAFTLIRICFA